MQALHFALGCALAAVTLTPAVPRFGPPRHLGVAPPDAVAAARLRAARPRPLLGPDGTPQPALPQAVPVDPAARTRAALYATWAQAHALEAELDGAVIWVDAGCCDARAVEAALELAESARTGKHLALDAPVFVTGAEMKLAAAVADRLTDEGHTLAFVVTR